MAKAKKKKNPKPTKNLDCQGVKLESGKVGKISFYYPETEMKDLGDLGKPDSLGN